MKRAFPVLFILLAGCIVQSFHPFYTDKSKVALPQLNGEWDAVTAFGDKVDATNSPPWHISGDQIIAYDSDSSSSRVQVVFFKLSGQLFCDSTAGDIGDSKTPLYWAWHVRRIHTVTKVETNGDLLTFKPLDLEWLTNRVTTGKVSLPHLDDGNSPLFTAKPGEWEKVLKKYASNTDAFPSNHMYVLKRHLTNPVK
jgi:hypothetical protein